ncbi:MAG: GTPase Era [Candidatus Uhrbacteria bacterium]
MKSGIVVLMGRSNTGKSTLLNALVGTKVSITSPKPQTTRQSIRGILNDPRGQIVFVDAPGVAALTRSPFSRSINEAMRAALSGIDVIGYVVDPSRAIGSEERRALAFIRRNPAPKLLIINKTDLPNTKRPYVDDYRALVAAESDPSWFDMIEVSALRRHNLNRLIDLLFAKLPEGAPLYSESQRTDISREFWIAELIREKIFLIMHDEIPYATTVKVDEVAERKNGTLYIAARITVGAERYRKMLIGARGQRIKEIGQMTRKELETAANQKVFVDLRVDVA